MNEPSDTPSIAELQRLCQDDGDNHDADLALAVPVLVEIAAAALALREAQRDAARARYEAYRQRDVSDAASAAIDLADTHEARCQEAYEAALDKVRP